MVLTTYHVHDKTQPSDDGGNAMALDWRKTGDEWIATREGRTVFSIEKRRGGYGLRRWSVRRDGTSDMAGVEIVKSVKEAKEYANNLSRG
jgi:hypothetical protein